MELKDVKVGIKVELLGKHGAGDKYDNVEDWFKIYKERKEVQQIKKQGYGIVVKIDEDGEIMVGDSISNNVWLFLPSDLKPYEEAQENKTPKEWLLTPFTILTARNDVRVIVLENEKAYDVSHGCLWCGELDEKYDENLKYIEQELKKFDIMKIEYKDKIVWERKVNYVSFDEAVKSGRRIRNEKWANFYTLQGIIEMWNVYSESTAREEISGLWEIE